MILDLVIPAYNEADRLEKTLRDYAQALKNYDAQILVVDDGSTDGTVALVESLADHFEVPLKCLELNHNVGKGAAVRAGFAQSRPSCELVFFADADGSTPAKEFETLLTAWKQGAQVVIASRALGTIDIKQHWLRQHMGQWFNVFFQSLFRIKFLDTQCGFKLFAREVAQKIVEKSKVDRFAFDVEWILIAQENGFVVKEIPISWKHVEASRVHLVKDSLRMLYDLLKVHKRWRSGELKASD